MKRIAFFQGCGRVGCDGIDVIEVEDDMTDEELNDMAYSLAYENACSFGYDVCDCEDPDCEVEDHDDSHIEGWWEEYDPEKHDQLKPGGGSWFK